MRILLVGAILAVVFTPTAFPQTIVSSARISRLLHRFEAEVHDPLRCEVIPLKPVLNFSFRFQAGYVVHVPLSQYLGGGHRWTMLIRVTPEGGETVNLMSRFALPEIPRTRVVAEVGGGYLVGEGRYGVEWMMFDDSLRVCRKRWTVEARRGRSERGIRVAMPPETVRGFSWFAPDAGAAQDDASPVRLTVLLHAAPLSTRRTTLRASDRLMLVGLLSSLLERLPTRSVRLVVFNLDQQKELFRQESFSPKALDQVAQAIDDLQLGVVDYRVLQNKRGHIDMVTDLVNAEMQAERPSDVVLFLGPATRYWDNVPRDALERNDGAGPQFFYFQYRPFYRPGTAFPDVISLALRRLRGKTMLIHSPGEFAKAIAQVERQARPTPPEAAPNSLQ